MSTRIVFEQYREAVLKDPDKQLEDFKQVFDEVQHSPALYCGQPIDFLMQPMFLSPDDTAYFAELTRQMFQIMEKVTRRYLEDETFRRYFRFSPLLEELILKDPGYTNDIPMGRFDIFYDFETKWFQFCEVNTDGSSGMEQQRELTRIFRRSPSFQAFTQGCEIEDFELFDSWVKIVQDKYAEFSHSDQLPQVAIVDWLGEKISTEFIAFREAFEKAGCQTVIADPRRLEYRDGKLYHQDFRIDCIYRRAVTSELIERADEVENFIKAYLQGDVCVVGSLRSQVVHNKIVFALLHDPEKTPFLTEAERRFVHEHIPYTVVFNGQDPEMVKQTRENKDQYVLKPMDKYAANGVWIGKDFPAAEWQKMIDQAAREDYLLQRFCPLPQLPMAYFDQEKTEFIATNFALGLFMYDGHFQGLYTRVGRKNIIASSVECFKLPAVVITGKQS